MSDSFEIICPNSACAATLELEGNIEDFAGQSIACPECASKILIPQNQRLLPKFLRNIPKPVIVTLAVIPILVIGLCVLLGARHREIRNAYIHALHLAENTSALDDTISALNKVLSGHHNSKYSLHARKLLSEKEEQRRLRDGCEQAMKESEILTNNKDYERAIDCLETALDEYPGAINEGMAKNLLKTIRSEQTYYESDRVVNSIESAMTMPASEVESFLRKTTEENPNATNLNEIDEFLNELQQLLALYEQKLKNEESDALRNTFFLVMKETFQDIPYGPFKYEDGYECALGHTRYRLSIAEDGTFTLENLSTGKVNGPYEFNQGAKVVLRGYDFVIATENLNQIEERQKEHKQEQAFRIAERKEFEEDQRAKGLVNMNDRWVKKSVARKQRKAEERQKKISTSSNASGGWEGVVMMDAGRGPSLPVVIVRGSSYNEVNRAMQNKGYSVWDFMIRRSSSSGRGIRRIGESDSRIRRIGE